MLTLHRRHNRKVTILRLAALSVLAVLVLSLSVAVAVASGGGTELRRVDTSNVNKSTDIKAVSDHTDEGDTEHAQDDAHNGDEAAAASSEHDDGTDEHESEAAAGDHGEEAGAGEEEEVHHPAWMIPGWQSIFTVLAVIYFGLGVTLLPHIMAKEEH